jgi:hypothetical protein
VLTNDFFNPIDKCINIYALGNQFLPQLFVGKIASITHELNQAVKESPGFNHVILLVAARWYRGGLLEALQRRHHEWPLQHR